VNFSGPGTQWLNKSKNLDVGERRQTRSAHELLALMDSGRGGCPQRTLLERRWRSSANSPDTTWKA
jgi:hypothetical protein